MKHLIGYIWYKYIGFLFRLLPIKKNRIVMSNLLGKGYGDNPKYIANELLSRKDVDLEIVWLVKDKYYDDIPSEIKQVKRGTIKELYYLSTAKIWVDNSRKHIGVTKRKSQYYIQTWHGDLFIKMLEKDVEESLPKMYIDSAIADSKMVDLITSGSSFFTNVVRRAFWYDGDILECGSPKTDPYISNNKKSDKEYKPVVYAPTFRDNGDNSCCNIDYDKLIETLENKYNCKWKVIIRFHSNVSYLQNSITYTDEIINGSKFSDIKDMIIDCDMLITDYSSTAFDAMYAKKLVLLYVPDEDEYYKVRKSQFKNEDIPFPRAKTNEELFNNIKNLNEKDFYDKVKIFLEEKIKKKKKGIASKSVADVIIKQTNI